MITLTTHYNVQMNRVVQAVQDAEVRTFSHAAGRIRKSSMASVERDPKPSLPGQPPHTRKGNRLKKAILYDADRFGAVIGPARSKFGTAGQAHEMGGEYKGQRFDERPFMFPALEREAPNFAGAWLGSVGG